MKIEISDDTAVGIMADVMINDHRRLVFDIQRYQEKTILSDVEQKDLDNWIHCNKSLEVVLDYYLGSDWRYRYVG